MKFYKSFYAFILLVFLWNSCFAIDTLVISNTSSLYDFKRITHQYLEILPDTKGNLGFEDIQKMTFLPLTKKEITSNGEYLFSKKSPYVWIRFIIRNKNKDETHWLIEFLDFNIKNIHLYFPNKEGEYLEYKSGFTYPFSTRKIIHKNLDFDILVADSPQVCYARIEPGSSTVLSVELKSYKGFIEYSLTEYMLLGLFYGIMLVMLIYNLILYVNIREKHYLYYVFYVCCVGLASMCHDGIGFQYLWPNHPEWNKNIQIFAHFGLVLWTLFYSKWFLNTKNNTPKTDTIIQYMIILISILLVAVLLFNPTYAGYLIPAANIPFLIIYIAGIKIYKNGYKPARFFLMAFSFFFLGFIIRIVTYFGLIDNSIFTVYSYNIGVVIEMILFSVAIGDKIRIIKEQREAALIEKDKAQQQIIEHLFENEKLKTKVNRELETKVKERTEEVERKNEELKVANEKLKFLTDQANEWNIKLDLDNRKLQTDVKELEKARVMLKDIKFDEFSGVFPDERACLQYLAELKWQNGYQCKKCTNSTFGKSKTPFGRRCTKCNYDESATADTLFHRLRFPITKAFYIVYLVSIKDKEVTLDEMSEVLSLRKGTCWSFRKKITEARKSTKKQPGHKEAEGWAALALISLNH